MSKYLKTLECGSIPEELFKALENGYSVYMTPCKSCGKTLISVKNGSSEINGETVKIYGFFQCECGAKFKRAALELPGAKNGYTCAQGLVKKLVKTRTVAASRAAKGKQITEVVAYAIDFYFEGKRKRYVVYPDVIKLKTPKESVEEA